MEELLPHRHGAGKEEFLSHKEGRKLPHPQPKGQGSDNF